jgi:hypothetical protein
MDEPTPPSDRRAGERHLACFPAAFARTDDEPRPSIIRDLSESGALLLVLSAKLAVGDEIHMRLFIAEDPTTFRPASGRVVRIERLAPGEAGPWEQRVAVQFTEPLTMYAEEIVRFSELAERFR